MMRRYWIIAAMLGFFLAGCSSQSAQSNESPYELEDIYYYLQAVSDMESRGVLSSQDAATQRGFYLAEAQVISGQSLTEAQVADSIFSDDGQSWLRFLNFVNLIWVFASLIIVLSSVWIFAKYIFPVLKRIPIIVYEILLYMACAAFIFGGLSLEINIRQFVALPSVLGLIFLLPFSYARHFAQQPFKTTEVVIDETGQKVVTDAQEAERKARQQQTLHRIRRDFMLQSIILTLIWGAIAIAYESVLIGFMTVIVLMAALVLSPFVPFIVKRIGFMPYDIGASVLVVSFVLVMIFLVGEVLTIRGIYADIFQPGVFWIGTDAYFAALAVLAARRYHRGNRGRFIRWQIVSIISGLTAIFIGSYWNIPVIQEIAGTYFLIYILEKYIEMQNWRKHWAWASLGLGLILYLAALLMNMYPQFFLLQ
ncbi:MAG: hypothetical protein Q9P01_01835 [Anaerolineae bacterium]|nr:hypothetical protein [Anaerolineae bacterium]MDQ7033601.1 hypothetical protein [Anaerolineae bacterium]